MANPEHLAILQQGVDAWNEWRRRNPGVRPDLSRANLRSLALFRSDLRDAALIGSDLFGVSLRHADLRHADLFRAILAEADLSEADLTGTNLGLVNLSGADLTGTNLTKASMGLTVIGGVDLSEATGLETVIHDAPSTIGIDTIYKSRGNIPEDFLRGAGVPESFIGQMGSLTGRVVESYSCFISHSSEDQEFAERLHTDLQRNGVRSWFAPKVLRIGDRFRDGIDQSIKAYDKLLLVLSKSSIHSKWVAAEVKAALDKERALATSLPDDAEPPTVLFPIRLDDAIDETSVAWAREIRRNRHVGDFSRWRDGNAYQRALAQLLRTLILEGAAEAERVGAE
jgi:hypothetical protein